MKDYSELVHQLRGVVPMNADEAIIDAAADAIEALQRDAARYRWLRDTGPDKGLPFIAQRHPASVVSSLTGEYADAAIDAVMKDAP